MKVNWSKPLLDFLLSALNIIATPEDRRQNKTKYYALGYVIREGMTDKDAVRKARERTGENLSVAEFRKWLPQLLARFGEAARGEDGGEKAVRD